MFTTKASFKKEFKKKLSTLFGKALEESSSEDCYAALASLVRDELTERWVATNNAYLTKESRQVYYFSLEFLLGQFLESHLLYLGVRDICEEGLRELGISMEKLIGVEPDAGLGNGGLGRLAACFLDSIAALSLPGHGCGIRYKYGLFMQKIVDGYQVELPDNWLREVNVWEIRKPDKAVEVRFGGEVRSEARPGGGTRFWLENYAPVRAVPYDVPIMGYRNNTVNTLRLWSAESVGNQFDFQSFSRGEYVGAVANKYAAEAISEVLYPDDSNYQNRVLRLKQQYFFVSAGLQSIVRRYKKKDTGGILKFADRICVQINDTHPALAVPELMRILMDEEGLSWDEAWGLTTGTIAYTNHTIMPEALEKWPVDTMRELLPRIYMIIEEINRRFCAGLAAAYPGDVERWSRMAVIGDGVVRMAHLAIVGSFSVNGVAEVHSELLRSVVLKDFYEYYPRKFNNKTNGVTHRRWIIKANPGLAEFLFEKCRPWTDDPVKLEYLAGYADNGQALDAIGRIKRRNKELLAAHILETAGVKVDPSALFDVQIKRIHAYKRQLLNLMHIMHLYNTLKDGGDIGTPRVFLMGGKAAPSYYYAKNVIKLANELAKLIAAEPACSDRLSLVFLENYGISLAERIFPAAEVSEQISTASKEASGTSNMKFMMNGAVTIGTADGANIEIRRAVGDENFILFGMTVEEVLAAYASGDYDPVAVIRSDPRLLRIMDMLQNGFSPALPHDEFSNIMRSLVDYKDEFFILKDFDSYAAAQARISELYADRTAWNRMSLMNIAKSGVFSSDNTIRQYARDIWKVEPLRR